jgi:putative thioredoxin
VAVVDGQLVDGFLGALPEAQVRQWVGQVLAVADKMGLALADAPGAADGADGGPAAAGPDEAGSPLPPGFAEARDAMERGDFDGAARAFEEALVTSPDDPTAKAGLAQVNLIRRVRSYDEPQVRRAAAERPGDVSAQVSVADIDLATGHVDEAFDRLLGVVRRTSGEDRDQARAHLVSLFDILPPRDPRVTKARSALASLLF